MVRLLRATKTVGALAAVVAACAVPALDLDGKACPCSDGYVCDPATNTCVHTLGAADAGVDANDAGVDAAPAVDAAPTIHGLDMSNLVKVSATMPLIDSPTSMSLDCGTFAISYAPESNLQTGELVATTFVDPDTKTFWIPYPCKNADVGWSIALASWDRVAPTATIAPPRTDAGGINPILANTDMRNDGMLAVSVRQMHMAFGGDHQVYGTVSAYDIATTTSQMLPVIAPTPTAITAASMHTDDPTVLQGNGSGWYAQAGAGTDVLFYKGTFYLYGLYTDGTSVTADGNPVSSIGLSTSTDMLSSTFRTTALATGWSDPMVSYDSGMFHMVARRLDDNNLYYVRGTAPDQFDFAHPQLIDLTARAGKPGAWDELRWVGHPGSDEPLLASAKVIDGTMYIFYMAGSPSNTGGAEYQEVKRGLGVFTVPVLP